MWPLSRIAGVICAVSLLSMSGCLSKPDVICDCDTAEKELRSYMLQYLDAVEDRGNLRQQLKACQEAKLTHRSALNQKVK